MLSEQVSEFQRILESMHVMFAGRELATTQSFVWSVVGGFTKDIVAFLES